MPLDLALHRFFKENRSIGSKDRQEVREKVVFLFKNLRAIDYPQEQLSWEERVDRLEGFQIDPSWPKAVQVSLPDFLYEALVATWGEEAAFAIGYALNTPAPVTIRANTAKISRSDLLKELEREFRVVPTKVSPLGITFLEPVRFDPIPLYKKGFFEVQDEGSQLVALKVEARPKQLVLDYCSGSGGKSLAIAPQMGGKGALFLHDVRLKALQQARKRLKKAGVETAQLLPTHHRALKQLEKKCDWVLVDAPCSGTGTLRRSPEMKWRLSWEMVDEMVLLQRELFDEALRYVKPGGKIVYATCSILEIENQKQVEYFLSRYPLQVDGEVLSVFPKVKEMDGFFACRFRLEGDLFGV